MTAARDLGHTVLGVVTRRRRNHTEFLLLRRIQRLGGFWQPVTGGVNEGETPREAVLREIREETGLGEILRVRDLHLAYEFVTQEGKRFREQAFAVEVPGEEGVVLSGEHDSHRWVGYQEALDLVPYDEYRWALMRTVAICSGASPATSN